MNIETLVLGELGTNCYLVSQAGSDQVLVIDPAAEPEKIRAAYRARFRGEYYSSKTSHSQGEPSRPLRASAYSRRKPPSVRQML